MFDQIFTAVHNILIYKCPLSQVKILICIKSWQIKICAVVTPHTLGFVGVAFIQEVGRKMKSFLLTWVKVLNFASILVIYFTL
jgi:hypothetical protein